MEKLWSEKTRIQAFFWAVSWYECTYGALVSLKDEFRPLIIVEKNRVRAFNT